MSIIEIEKLPWRMIHFERIHNLVAAAIRLNVLKNTFPLHMAKITGQKKAKK